MPALLVVPGLLFGQLAGFAHAHVDSPHNHDARPHLHSPFELPHDTDVSHDDDAIYVPSVDLAPGEAPGSGDESVAVPTLFAASGIQSPIEGPAFPASCRGPAPPLIESACPLFVRHLALLL